MTALIPSTEPTNVLLDRRTAGRYPIQQKVQYKASLHTIGTGKTINMGSNGALFTAEHSLAVGAKIEVAIHWPALLDGVCPLKFVATGIVVRTDEPTIAVRFLRYEFRTRSTRE